MGKWTLRHRVKWFVVHVRRGGIRELRRRLARYISPEARAARRRHLADAADFDSTHGYRTNEVVAIDDLTVAGERVGSNHYAGAATYNVVGALEMLDLPFEQTTFVDLGCGMGKPLLIAADHPFKRIVGVEFARELVDIAIENFQRRADRNGTDDRIELLCMDAATFTIPDGPVAFFFFNSFGPPTLNATLDNIHRSWQNNQRPVRFIYVNIQHLDVVHEAGFKARVVAPDYSFTIFEPM